MNTHERNSTSIPKEWLELGVYRFMKVKVNFIQSCPTLCDPVQSMEFSRPEYWSGYPFPSPGDIPNPGIEPRSPHCRQILYQLSHKGSPRILEWVAYPFSSESSWPRNWTGFFYIASGFFTNWASRETPLKLEFTRKLLLQETGFTGHFLSAYLQNHSTIQ